MGECQEQFYNEEMMNKMDEKYENLEKEYLPTIYNNYLTALIETKITIKLSILLINKFQVFLEIQYIKQTKGMYTFLKAKRIKRIIFLIK